MENVVISNVVRRQTYNVSIDHYFGKMPCYVSIMVQFLVVFSYFYELYFRFICITEFTIMTYNHGQMYMCPMENVVISDGCTVVHTYSTSELSIDHYFGNYLVVCQTSIYNGIFSYFV